MKRSSVLTCAVVAVFVLGGSLPALAQSQEPSHPIGPLLTGREMNAMSFAVSRCWNIGRLSTEAQGTIITIEVDMNPDGTPQDESIRLIGSSGGSSSAAEQAFQMARRAIIICGRQGFPLPADKFNQWQSIEMTFDPEQKRFK